METAKRLIDFLAYLVLEGISKDCIAREARKKLFIDGEEDSAVYVYDEFDLLTESHPEADLVIIFENNSTIKIRAIWKGINIALEGNFPTMGWDKVNGEFGLGGDWWKDK